MVIEFFFRIQEVSDSILGPDHADSDSMWNNSRSLPTPSFPIHRWESPPATGRRITSAAAELPLC